ncbi:MAG: protein kinase, partial [archaeon]|nr:protein kinase [archaeon]
MASRHLAIIPTSKRLQRCRSLMIRRSLKKGGKLEESYRLAGEVGSGSFAVVYRAFPREPGSKEVAIKVISKNKAGNELELIENEINLHAECDHPNVGKIF